MNKQIKSEEGSYLTYLEKKKDHRGEFLKLFNSKMIGKEIDIKEVFCSVSRKDTLRGIHFQTGKSACSKLIFCSWGSVIDVVVDLRTGSPYFNKPVKYNLEADLPSVLFVPSWCGHGFLALEENTEMYYFTSHEYDPMRDKEYYGHLLISTGL